MSPERPQGSERHECRLCGAVGRVLPPAHGRRFLECPRCRLVYAHPGDLPDPEVERARYDTHDNRVDDERYRGFLSPALRAVQARLAPGAAGVDFGAGPGPALASMLGEAGYTVALYDPFYHPDPAPLRRRWDFVVCTETVEHFHEPGREFARLEGMLAGPGSHLVVMTRILEPGQALEDWWYARDPTHVAFYRPETLKWIAKRHGWRLERPEPHLAVFSPRATRGGALRRTELVAWVAAGVLGIFALAGAWQGVRGRPEGWFVFAALGIFAFPALMAALVARERRRRATGGTMSDDDQMGAKIASGNPEQEDA